MMLKTIAIDDEPLALQLMKGYMDKTPFMEVVGCFESPLEAMTYISEHVVDLAFLDIEMPDVKGTELTRILQNGPKIIFTTAYEKYALEGYKLDVVDYLLKPFSYDEFLRASHKALTRIKMETENQAESDGKNDFIFVKSDYKLRRIRIDSIRYIEGFKDYIKIYLDDTSKPILSLNSLKNMEITLPGSRFMRVHRSFIVNLEKIESIDRSRIMIGDFSITIGSNYNENFQAYLKNNSL